MAAHIVTCKVCGEKFDANKEEYVKPKERQYYHKKCHDKMTFQIHNMDIMSYDVEGLDELKITYHYLVEVVKIDLDFQRFKRQWDNLIKKGYTAKGIHWALKYFYGIEKGDPDKACKGIGIVDFIYKDAEKYWGSKVATEAKVRETMNNVPIHVDIPATKHILTSTKKRVGPKFNLSEALEGLDD